MCSMKHFFPIFFVVWTNLKLRSPRGHFYFVCVSPLSRCTAIIVRSWTSLFPAFLKKFCRFWKKLKKNWCRIVCRPIVFLEQFGVFWFVVSRFNCVRVTLVFFYDDGIDRIQSVFMNCLIFANEIEIRLATGCLSTLTPTRSSFA